MGDLPITFTPGEVATYYAARVPHLKQRCAAEWRGACPIHHGKNDNFAVEPATGRWFCHSTCGRGGDILALEEALTGGHFPTRKAEVFRLVGRIEPECRHYGIPTNGNSTGTAATKPTKSTGAAGGWREIARYQYVGPHGNLLFEVIRYRKPNGDKGFTQCRPDGNGGWIWNLDGVRRVPYRLPKLLNAETVYLPEGEKDVHTLEAWGLAASCNPGGSGNSHLYAEWLEYFLGRHVIILVDNDQPGRKHAAAVAAALLGAAASILIVELPSLPPKGDVTDWRDAGGTFEQFRELVEAAAPMDAAALSELRARWGLADEEPRNLALHAKTADTGSLNTRCLSDVEAKPVCWLWPGRIARGKLTIIAGNPGLGKSQITASIAAVVTNGGRWPVDCQQCEPGNVLFLSAEDDPADTLRPRLEAAGADLSRVHIVDGVTLGYGGDGRRMSRAFTLQADVQALGSKLTELRDVAVVVIDPITAYLGDTDSHKNADVRGLLAPLSELAARHDTAIIGVSHLTKAEGAQALMRVTGSLAFVAAARAAYLVTADPQDKTRRLFLPMKNNLGPDTTGLAFHIEGATISSPAGTLVTSRVSWESVPVAMTADEAMDAESASRNVSALDTAIDWLRDTLARGPVAAADVFDLAKGKGIANKTLQRASKELEVRKEKVAMTGGWSWSLPSKVVKSAEGAHVSNVATFEEIGHLREPEESMAEVEL
jgi:putative DNA primase/helicase